MSVSLEIKLGSFRINQVKESSLDESNENDEIEYCWKHNNDSELDIWEDNSTKCTVINFKKMKRNLKLSTKILVPKNINNLKNT